jgi:glutamate carboxypeptidase
VFEPGHPFQKFERTSDSTARGPGIIDMKGGDVIIVHALKALKTAGVLAGLNVVVVMHGDEEKAGSPQALARADLIAAATGAAVALGFEDGDGNPATANIARRGATGWTLSVTGNPAHSSQVFSASVGYGAVYETARILDQWRQRLSGDPLLTFNPGLAIGGTAVTLDSTKTDGQASGKSNVVAKTMHVTGDIRAISPELLARAQRVMREVTSAPLAGTSSTLVFEDGYPPMAPTDGNKALLARYDEASRAVGAGAVTPVDPAKAGAADVSFVAPLVPQVIDGIGLAGADDHTDKETADLRWLAPLTKRAAVLLLRLSQTAGRPVP